MAIFAPHKLKQRRKCCFLNVIISSHWFAKEKRLRYSIKVIGIHRVLCFGRDEDPISPMLPASRYQQYDEEKIDGRGSAYNQWPFRRRFHGDGAGWHPGGSNESQDSTLLDELVAALFQITRPLALNKRNWVSHFTEVTCKLSGSCIAVANVEGKSHCC